jgi:hypothetical protein
MGVLDSNMVNTMLCGLNEYGQENLVSMIALQQRLMDGDGDGDGDEL